MVKQILRFARGHAGNGPVKTNELIGEMAKIVRDTFPKSISISVEAGGSEVWQIQGDPTELHQVLLNLCVNARDAMANRGELAISAMNMRLAPEAAAKLNVLPGPYVVISAWRTPDAASRPMCFRKFLNRFSRPSCRTRGPDWACPRSPGLSGTMVVALIDQALSLLQGDGIQSNALPALEDTVGESKTPLPEEALPVGHGEMILVIEDEETVCELIKTVLENYGYRVVTAQNGMQGNFPV